VRAATLSLTPIQSSIKYTSTTLQSIIYAILIYSKISP